jgi:hypothetical protein
MATPKLRCHLIAGLGSNTSIVRSVLASFGVVVARPHELSPPGEGVPELLRRRIQNADFVCGIVTDDPVVRENVIFELGFSSGANKPIIIVAEGKSQIPRAVASYPIVRDGLRDEAVLTFHLRAFLAGIGTPPTDRLDKNNRERPKEKVERESAPALVRRIPVMTVPRSESEAETLVVRSLRTFGANVEIKPNMRKGFQPDLIAWLPGPSTALGNPVVIELKQTTGAHPISFTAEQMQRYMELAHARSAFLLLTGGDGPEISVRAVPLGFIYIMGVAAFLALLSDKSLVRRITARRNQFSHTGS